LAGDLAGTAALPVVATGAITTAKLAAAAVTTAKITDANVTYAKIQNVSATDKVLGRVSTGAGTIEEIATTGTGDVVRATSPTLVTPVLGAATGTSLSVTGQLTSTVATGTAPLVVTSTTSVANLNIGGNAANVTGTVAIANGGTGQTTKAAAFNALSPMTASGDIIYGGTSGAGTVLAKGTDGQVLTLSGGNPTWTSGVSTISVKTAAYTLTTSDNYIIVGSNAGSGLTFTLPTAVGNTGKEFTIKNISANSVSIATTSSQKIVVDSANSAATSATLGIEASNNWIRVISDGAQWIAFRALF
jgi:hypothetical protein